jgi:hypothetical protein
MKDAAFIKMRDTAGARIEKIQSLYSRHCRALLKAGL